MNKKDAIPVIIAALVALVVTALVKWLLPTPPSPLQQQPQQQKELSIPEIPLVIKKEPKKRKNKKSESFVLVIKDSFKKDEKIDLKKLKWEKWPYNAVQPYFIAKDHQDKPLNNGADYSNALKMWAKSDIPAGVPLVMDMLTDADPVKKAEAEKKKIASTKEHKEAAEKAKIQKELEDARKEGMVRKGMRAISFAIDQRSATALSMLKPGDFVDVLIITQKSGQKSKTHTYKGLRILALDGVTKFDLLKKALEEAKNKPEAGKGGLLSSVMGSNNSTPRNVTLEVPEDLVEEMLANAEANGVILSLRNPEDEIETPEDDEETTDEETEYEKIGNIRTESDVVVSSGNIASSNTGAANSGTLDQKTDISKLNQNKKAKKIRKSQHKAKSTAGRSQKQVDQPKITFDPIVEGLLRVTRKASLGDTHIREIKKLRKDEEESRKLMNSFLLVNRIGTAPSYTQRADKIKEIEAEEHERKLMNGFFLSNSRVSPNYTQLTEKAKEEAKDNLANNLMRIMGSHRLPSFEQLKEKARQQKIEDEKNIVANNIIHLMNSTLSPSTVQLEEKAQKQKIEDDKKIVADNIIRLMNSTASPSFVQLEEKAQKQRIEDDKKIVANNIIRLMNSTTSPSFVQLEEKAKKREIEDEKRAIANNMMRIISSATSPSYAQIREKAKNDKIEEDKDKIARSIVQVMNNATSPSVIQLRERAEAINKKHQENLLANSVLHIINNGISPTAVQARERQERIKKEEETAYLVRNLIAQSSNTMLAEGRPRVNGFKHGGGRYEVVSGKIVGEEDEDESPVATIYRKLTASTVEFDEDGRPIKENAEGEAATGSSSGGSGSRSSSSSYTASR